MRVIRVLPAIAVLMAVPCRAQVPPLPPPPLPPPPLPAKPDYPLIDALDYADDSAARAAWKPMKGSAGVSVVTVAGRRALRMPCNLEGTLIERASWDRSVSLDLASCQGIQFRVFCSDDSPLSHCTCYLESEGGWYSGSFSLRSSPGRWKTVTIDKDKTRIEGKPAGWSTIKTIRISAWRGKNANTEFYLADLGLLGADARIVVVRGESIAEKSRNETKAVRELSREMGEYLAGLGLAYCTMSDLDLTADRLKGKRVVILPHNPSMPDRVADEIATYLGRGGKLVSFYGLAGGLRPVVGIEGGRHVKQTRKGEFASIRMKGKGLGGAPPAIGQQSWNITEAKPIPGRAKTVAEWYDDKGAPTGQAAVIVSDNCVHMTHVMLSDDIISKRRLLLAMVGHFMPEAWQRASRKRIERIGVLGAYRNFEKARRAIRTLAARDPAVLQMVDRAVGLRSEAERLVGREHYGDAMSKADAAAELMLDAYCTAQKPLKGEHRAFWCHSAFGVSGMSWDQAVKTLADNGFTAILPNMLWGGTAYYDSKVLPVAPEVKDRGDQIAECLAACKKYGVECHIWKVNYNMSGRAPKSFVERMKSRGRTQVGLDGKPHDRWLCPSHPENQKLEIDSMVEVAGKYDVHGVHFDYIRYPNGRYCFCDGCRERFERVIGGKASNWPGDVADGGKHRQRWLDFRRQQITTVVAAVAERVRKVRPGVKISAAVFRNWPVDRDRIGQDWRTWCEKGYLDFVCPMDYIADDGQFGKAVESQLEWVCGVPCYPGIGLSVWPPGAGICKLIEQIKITRRLKTGGFTIFNYSVKEAGEIVPLCGKGITRKHAKGSE